MNIYDIPFFPFALNGKITFFQRTLCRLTVHFHCIAQFFAIGITVQIARYDLSLHPTRNPDFHRKIGNSAGSHGHLYIPVPGIRGGLFQSYFLPGDFEGRFVGHKQIDINFLIFHSINISRNRRNKTAGIRRATGTSEPGRTLMLADRFQRIGIKESPTVQRNPRQYAIIKGTFEYIVIFGISFQQKQAIIPIHITDSGTSLTIGRHVG